MTGYGRAVQSVAGMTVTVEIKSVNHRFFEFNSLKFLKFCFKNLEKFLLKINKSFKD